MPHAISFRQKASGARNGIALVFDLEGFSKFFCQPDIQDYVPIYLNRIFEAVSICIFGGQEVWAHNKELTPLSLPRPAQKFMGDGALFVWTQPEDGGDFSTPAIVNLVNRLWNLKKNFAEVTRSCHDKVPVADLPRRIRFGLARGTIYELTGAGTNATEHIGFCINLASRLQKYCPDLGIIASARVLIDAASLEKNGYIRVIAKDLRGFPREVVLVDREEFESLDDDVRLKLFDKT